ncbi:alpha/beta hydrolase [Mesorhizobium tamadayense]|uniref:Alpha/beta hydrolase n=1 Tax=Mesorhizobium tamadayense TaxID=425306 RepID=A0A3P3FH71_9HYPH|nr:MULTISPECIES: alpha/beta hydrolase [Mesorhizobium]RRH98030.1 alpha/beta hydrolase [Mesorhizobium tamadayense]TIS57368.1 MAG: alpha/beta fold hydrolase [Mesorhizobium sp.]TIS85858.1 MAG: alpha/beta fold hydrolase [Mesorhizobium sp.]
MALPTETFDWNGTKIAWGSIGSGAPLVLVHGTPFSSHVWHRIAPALARNHTVYFYDLPGYGRSGKHPGQDVSLGIQNTALAVMLDFWRLGRTKVIAHDFGGATALRAHLIDGCDYERLLLIDPVAVRPWGSPFVQHVRQHETAFAGAPEYIHAAILKAYISGAAARPLSDDELEPYVAPWVGPVGQPAFYRQIAQMDQRFTDEIEGRYGEFRCPVTLLWGEEDRWIPAERGQKLAALLPDCSLDLIPRSGHLMQEDAPEAIVSAALRFFAG